MCKHRSPSLWVLKRPPSPAEPSAAAHLWVTLMWGAGVTRISQRTSATRRTPLHRRAMQQHSLHQPVLRGGFRTNGGVRGYVPRPLLGSNKSAINAPHILSREPLMPMHERTSKKTKKEKRRKKLTAKIFIHLRQVQQQRPDNWASSSDAIGRADAAQTRRRHRRAEVSLFRT